jgi:hypothetical protein
MKFSLWSLISVIAVCTAILFSGGVYEITLLEEGRYVDSYNSYKDVNVPYIQTNKLTGESRYCLLSGSANTRGDGPVGSDRCVAIDNER